MTLSRLLPGAVALTPRLRRVLGALSAVMLAGLAAHLTYTATGVGGHVADAVVNRWGQDVVYAAAAGLCALRALGVARGRAAWLALAVALGLYTAGSVYYTAVFYSLSDPPFPSPADVGWLALYPGAYVCLGLIVHDSVRRLPPSVWFDGLIATLAVASVGVGLVVVPILSKAHGTLVAVVTNSAYPVGDLVLLSLTIGVVALHGWRGRGLLLPGDRPRRLRGRRLDLSVLALLAVRPSITSRPPRRPSRPPRWRRRWCEPSSPCASCARSPRHVTGDRRADPPAQPARLRDRRDRAAGRRQRRRRPVPRARQRR